METPMTDNMTATESSTQTKTGNSPIQNASFLTANGTQFLEDLRKFNSAMLKDSFKITQEMLTSSQECLQTIEALEGLCGLSKSE
jgi:hypothetical protein